MNLPTFLRIGVLVLSVQILSCQPEVKPEPFTARNHSETPRVLQRKDCLPDALCAEIDYRIPVLQGEQAEAAAKINASIERLLYKVAPTDTLLPLEEALDTSLAWMLRNLNTLRTMRPGSANIRHFFGIDYQNLLFNDAYYGYELTATMDMGRGPFVVKGLAMYDLNTGEPLRFSDIVPDSAAVQPLLQKHFLKGKEAMAPNGKVSDILYDGKDHLSLPLNVCVLPEGVRVIYKAMEVAGLQVGASDFVLSWKELDGLADKSRFFQ